MTLDDAVESLDAYANKGIPTGSFLQAVLENDLFEALGRADTESRHILFDICAHIHNHLTPACWGSPVKVRHWLKQKREERQSGKK